MLMKGNQLQSIETRKKLNFGARFIITMFIVSTFIFLVWLLFFIELPQSSRDLVNIMVGAYVAVLSKATDYWFKDNDDPEHKETTDLQLSSNNGDGEENGY